jgi:TolA-binding protein
MRHEGDDFLDPWLYIALLGAAALMYGWMLPKRGGGKSPEAVLVKNMEATLEQYMADIGRENDELIDLVTHMKQDHASRITAIQEQISELRQRIVELERHDRRSTDISQQTAALVSEQLNQARSGASVQEAERDIQGPVIEDHAAEEKTDEPLETIRDRYAELFMLHGQGKSLDYIARQTGMQRGEVQLILQLAEREGRHA